MATRRTNGAKTSALVLSRVMSPSRTSGRKSSVPIGPLTGSIMPSAPRGCGAARLIGLRHLLAGRPVPACRSLLRPGAARSGMSRSSPGSDATRGGGWRSSARRRAARPACSALARPAAWHPALVSAGLVARRRIAALDGLLVDPVVAVAQQTRLRRRLVLAGVGDGLTICCSGNGSLCCGGSGAGAGGGGSSIGLAASAGGAGGATEGGLAASCCGGLGTARGRARGSMILTGSGRSLRKARVDHRDRIEVEQQQHVHRDRQRERDGAPGSRMHRPASWAGRSRLGHGGRRRVRVRGVRDSGARVRGCASRSVLLCERLLERGARCHRARGVLAHPRTRGPAVALAPPSPVHYEPQEGVHVRSGHRRAAGHSGDRADHLRGGKAAGDRRGARAGHSQLPQGNAPKPDEIDITPKPDDEVRQRRAARRAAPAQA